MQDTMIERRYERLINLIHEKEPFYELYNLDGDVKELFEFLHVHILEIIKNPPRKLHSRVLFEFEMNSFLPRNKMIQIPGAKLVVNAHKFSSSVQVKSFKQTMSVESYETLLMKFACVYELTYKKEPYSPKSSGHDVLVKIIFGDPNAVV